MHGTRGLFLAYAAVQGPMLVGLAKGRAEWHKYVSSPRVAVPLTVVAGIAVSTAASLLGAPPDGLAQFALGVSISAGLGYYGGHRSARSSPGPGAAKTYQRGTVVAEEDPARGREKQHTRGANAHRANAPRGNPRDTQITLAGSAIPIADETKHFKLIGTTGTGKSTAIREILSAALGRGDRAVIADPDGGYLQNFYDPDRRDVVLNPFDARSVKWNPFAEISNGYDVDQLARSLIPDQANSDRVWTGYARTFFSAVTRQAHRSGVNDIGELFRLLVVANTDEIRTLVEGTPAQPFLAEHNPKFFDSVRSVTADAIGAIGYIAAQKAESFSVRQWVRDEKQGVLFMPYKAGQIAALRSTISGWMRLAIFEAMDQEEQQEPDSRRLWFVVDELDALGQIDGLKDALARLRKFGGRAVLGFQSIAQVSSTYGQGDAHTIVENCANTLILRCSASEGGGTARFASQLIGEREISRTTESHSHRYGEFGGSMSQSEHFSMEPAVLPAQIEQLPDLAGYLKQASDPRWHKVRLDAVQRWNQQRSNRGDDARTAHSNERTLQNTNAASVHGGRDHE